MLGRLCKQVPWCLGFTHPGLVHRQLTAAERQIWEERDLQEQAELAGHANAPVTAEEEALPGAL